MTDDILQEIRLDYDLCINEPDEYQKKVNSVSDLFLLKGKKTLMNDNCPAYVIRKYDLASIQLPQQIQLLK